MFKTLIPPAIPDPEEPDLPAPWTDDVLCVSYSDLWTLSMRPDATAIFHTLISSTRLNGLDPPDYLNLALDSAIPLPHEVAASEGS